MNPTDVTSYTDSALLAYTSTALVRMFSDLESYIYPLYAKSQPLLYALGNINFVVIPFIFIVFLAYAKLYKRHRLLNKFENKQNLKNWGMALVVYIILSFCKINLGLDVVFNFNVIILPVIAKHYGPLIACLFAMAQYLLNVIFSGSSLNLLFLIIAATSGCIYGLMLYRKRTKYTNCLSSKLVVSLICNVFMTTLIVWRGVTDKNIAMQMTTRTVGEVLLSPIYAIFIYLILRGTRYLKNKLKIK